MQLARQTLKFESCVVLCRLGLRQGLQVCVGYFATPLLRRLCAKTLHWKLPVRCQFSVGLQPAVAHSGVPLARHPWTPQVNPYLHRKAGNPDPGSGKVKGLGSARFCGFAQSNWPSSRLIEAMEWPCPRCTFLNKGELLECELCAQPYISDTSVSVQDTAVTGFPLNGQTQGEELGLEWDCSTCTFLNYGQQGACQMCGERRADAAEVPGPELPLASSFRPLREAQQPSMSGGIKEFSVDAAPKVMKEEATKVLQPQASQRSLTAEQTGASVAEASNRPLPIELEEDKLANDSRKRKMETSSSDQDGGSNSLLKMLHDERMKRTAKAGSVGQNDNDEVKPSFVVTKQKRVKDSMPTDVVHSPNLVIMFYNVWFREDVELHSRMAAIGNLIEDHQPHVICFQEVTQNIYNIFQKSSWWKQYECSVSPHLASQRAYYTMQLCRLSVSFRRNPFRNSVMGRELCLAELDVGSGKKIVIATTHLESPCPAPPTWDQMFSEERVQQAVEALSTLNIHTNTIFGGDMNWNEKLDGAPPLPCGWSDAWLELKPNEPGFTYDSKANPMLGGGRCLRSRLDRVFCHLKDFTLESIEMIGLQEIPGLTYEKEKKVRKQVQLLTLPVLPSDHFGLLLKIRRNEEKV